MSYIHNLTEGLKVTIVIVLFSLNSWSGESEPAANLPNNLQNILSCSMLNGNLTHKIIKNSHGNYYADLTFPRHFKALPKEELEQAKKEWGEWDGISKKPKDRRKRAPTIPIENSNIFNSDRARLETRINFFEKMFPAIDAENYKPTGKSDLSIIFNIGECETIQQGDLISITCSKKNPNDLNGIPIDHIIFNMNNRISTGLIYDQTTNEHKLVTSHKVDTHLIIATDNMTYRSSFTYTPNGNEEQCWLGEKKLSEELTSKELTDETISEPQQ